MATIVIGSQWGDEGKGKLVDILCKSAKLCCRAQGGNNAGHTIVANGQTYDFHLLPSGLVNPSCVSLIGSGVVVHVPSFFSELSSLAEKGLDSSERIFISDRAHVVFDLHQLVDGLEEVELGKKAVGTTKKGIGPAYSTKAARSGVRIAEIFNEEVFERKLRTLAAGYRKRFGDLLKYDEEEEIQRFKEYRTTLQPYVIDALPLLTDVQNRDPSGILIEGANALMLDLDWGTYPYVTSSNTGLGGVFTGLAMNPTKIRNIIGVVKAYTTRVGGGPFPTEDLTTAVGQKLQNIGKEVGVTTGRKRRCGWLDLVVVKYSASVNHYTSLNLTKLDILDDFEEIRIATQYKIAGEVQESFPADLERLANVEVVYETLKGWNAETTGAKTFDKLPEQAQAYVKFVEKFVGVPVSWIGTGPGRENMIVRA